MCASVKRPCPGCSVELTRQELRNHLKDCTEPVLNMKVLCGAEHDWYADSSPGITRALHSDALNEVLLYLPFVEYWDRPLILSVLTKSTGKWATRSLLRSNVCFVWTTPVVIIFLFSFCRFGPAKLIFFFFFAENLSKHYNECPQCVIMCHNCRGDVPSKDIKYHTCDKTKWPFISVREEHIRGVLPDYPINAAATFKVQE